MAFLACVLAIAGKHVTTGGGGDVHIELWQVINLLGAPTLALIFVRPVIDDVRDWWVTRHGDPPD